MQYSMQIYHILFTHCFLNNVVVSNLNTAVEIANSKMSRLLGFGFTLSIVLAKICLNCHWCSSVSLAGIEAEEDI